MSFFIPEMTKKTFQSLEGHYIYACVYIYNYKYNYKYKSTQVFY